MEDPRLALIFDGIFAALIATTMTQAKLLARLHGTTTGVKMTPQERVACVQEAARSVRLILETLPESFRSRFDSEMDNLVEIVQHEPGRLMN